MSNFEFTLFFFMLNISGVVAQATPDLTLPDQQDGKIKLDISNFANNTTDKIDFEHFAVFVKNKTNEYIPSQRIQGKYTKEENHLIFKPYFPFEKGLPYIVKVKKSTSPLLSYHQFQIGEKEKIASAKVLSIFPSANLVPENLLRFYIYFQTPMKQEEALKHIKLMDEKGNIDDHAFMKFKEELWSSDGKRLTILFDPGRIKRGVSTNEVKGPALEYGKRYHLNISKEWQDVYGQNLLEITKKEITVVEAYREKIKSSKWILEKPKANSQDKLVIHFDRIIDHALIQSMIQIKDNAKNLIEGNWEILEGEQQVQFIPKNKWKKGNYKIVLDTRLEDVSGNNLQNLLDYRIEEQSNQKRFEFIDFIIL